MSNPGYAEVIGSSVRGGSRVLWFGDGRDGDLHVADGETLVLDVVEDEGQVLMRYKSVYIGYGAEVKTSGRCNGLILCSQGNFENHGTITMDKCSPMLSSTESEHLAEPHIRLCGVVGGDGGKAGTGAFKYVQTGSSTEKNTITTAAAGGAPGTGHPLGGGNGSGSGAAGPVARNGGDGNRAPVGTALPWIPALKEAGKYGSGASTGSKAGGAGYGGSGAAEASDSDTYGASVVGNAGDAIGGGAIYIYCGGKFVNTGLITACGGAGAEGVGRYYDYANSMWGGTGAAASGGGGGGGGGIVAIVHNGDYTNRGSIKTDGGPGGAGKSYKHPNYSQATATSAAGADGENNPILITTLDELLATH